MKLLAEKMEVQIKTFKELARSASKSQKVGNVHDLRVTTRRLRVIFWLIKHGSTLKVPSGLRKAFHELGQTLGEQRQLDVALRDASHYKLDPSRLTFLQKKASLALAPLLTRKKRNKLVSQLKSAHSKLAKQGQLDFSRPIQTLLHNLNTWTKPPKNKTEVHTLRIQTKKILYVIEVLGHQALPLKRYKDCLGRVHDLEVLCGYFKNAVRVRTDEALEIKKAHKLFLPGMVCARKKLEQLKTSAKIIEI